MLTGPELGAAIEAARIAKGVSKKKLADDFLVKPPSVQGWVKYGRIDKSKLMEVIQYFRDVVDLDHWGLGKDASDFFVSQEKVETAGLPDPNEPSLSSMARTLLTKITQAVGAGGLGDDDLSLLLATATHLRLKNSSIAGTPENLSDDSVLASIGRTEIKLDESTLGSAALASTVSAANWDEYAFIDQYTAKAAAGSGYDNTHVVLRNTLAFKRDWLRMKGANPKNLNVIYADGESMWPTINDRDVLLVDDSQIEPKDGGIFVLESQEQGTLVKRLIQYGDSWIIQSDNPDEDKYPDIELPDGDIYEHRITGRVIWRGGDL